LVPWLTWIVVVLAGALFIIQRKHGNGVISHAPVHVVTLSEESNEALKEHSREYFISNPNKNILAYTMTFSKGWADTLEGLIIADMMDMTGIVYLDRTDNIWLREEFTKSRISLPYLHAK